MESIGARWEDEVMLAVNHLGWDVIEADGVSDYEGWGAYLLRNRDGATWGWVSWSYGSCSGCDGYEDADTSTPEACAEVFGELIQCADDEQHARDEFSAHKGW